MTSVIKAHVSYDGTFKNKRDPRYQFINWTDCYKVDLVISHKTKKDSNLVMWGSYNEMKALFDANRKKCVYATVSQLRILGDGTWDTNIWHYQTCGNVMPDDETFTIPEGVN